MKVKAVIAVISAFLIGVIINPLILPPKIVEVTITATKMTQSTITSTVTSSLTTTETITLLTTVFIEKTTTVSSTNTITVAETSILTETTPIFITTTKFTSPPTIAKACDEEFSSSGYWRHDLDDALRCSLCPRELERISGLASQLKGDSVSESVWRILNWEKNNIKYDYEKAEKPAEEVLIQTPLETISRGRGICSDYAILTAALLLEMNYSPVYVFKIWFEGEFVTHVAAAIEINDEFFILDQSPPPLNLQDYYECWSIYRGSVEAKRIAFAKIYSIYRVNDTINVIVSDYISAEEFNEKDLKLTSREASLIQSSLLKMFEEEFLNLRRDANLRELDETGVLPRGYSIGVVWRYSFPLYADYYHSVFHNQFVKEMFQWMMSDKRLVGALKAYNHFWLKVKVEANDLIVVVNLAKT